LSGSLALSEAAYSSLHHKPIPLDIFLAVAGGGAQQPLYHGHGVIGVHYTHAAPEAIPNASPIEGKHLPAIVEAAFTAQRTDIKVSVVPPPHHLPKHPSDVVSAEEVPGKFHKRETIAADALH